jgi:plastocyanin domain-containing protein
LERHLRTNKWFIQAINVGATVLAGLATIGCEAGSAPKVTEKQPAPAPASATDLPRVEVGAHGFQPSRLALNGARRIVFRRTSDATCATAVVFPGLDIEKSLPLNTDVTVELPPSARGELGFQCGMGMYRAKVVVQ